jgi:site-specific DNA-methyltransferase (adenine-specific)
MTFPDDYLNQVIQGDCIEVMRQMPDKCIDMVLTDPPYGINMFKKNGRISDGKLCKSTIYGQQNWDKKRPDKIYFDAMLRISKNQIIFGGNYFADYLPPTSCVIVWDKDNGTSDFADCELAWTSFKTAIRKFKYRWAGILQENMKNKEFRQHPTQKPIALMFQILSKYAQKDWLIFDPFAGSGSILVAAKQFGCKYFGCELLEKYCNIARQRLADVMPLFDAVSNEKPAGDQLKLI